LSLRLGTRVGDYEVIGMLGSGGMGAVYQVRHLISDRIEAMKVLLPDLTSTPELAERFVREIRLQASLSHPNIASLHNALHVENQLLMVMEYVDGETLADVLRRGPVSQRRAVDTGIQILAALEYAHSRGVVHRDIKPSNVIINSEGLAKLMDFGIARGIDDLDQLTQAGSAVGSMYYMSPEQVRAEAVDGRSDVYATGVTLFEAMTGERPIKGKTAAEVLQAQLEQVPRSPSLINPAIAESVSRIVLKALEKDPHWRYQSAGAFRADLVEVLPTLPHPPEGRTPPPPARRESTPIPAYTAKTPGSGSRVLPPTSSQALSFDPLGLERLRKDLAQHIGPMARVLVDRAAKRARSWQELYSQLAPEIPAGKERDRFLASCPRA
jgi:eukaryotic-like serine/threonine-protein kinase